MVLIRFGLLRLQQTAAPPSTLVQRANRLTSTARNKLTVCFKWVLFAQTQRAALQELGAVTQRHAEQFKWLDNSWLQENVSASDAECGAAVDLAMRELLGNGVYRPVKVITCTEACKC